VAYAAREVPGASRRVSPSEEEVVMFTFVLTVILIMGPGKDDVTQTMDMKSLPECFDAARAWDEQDAKRAGKDVVGFAAGCSIEPIQGKDG
jgi:hypothetical protein